MERLNDLVDAVRVGMLRAGPSVLAGAGIAVAAATGYALVLQPLQRDLAGIERRLAVARERAKKDPMQAPLKTIEADPLAAFYAKFPTLPAVPELVANLEMLARKNGVSLDSGEYALADERGAKVQRYEVSLPVRGNYGQIRAFVHEALGATPTAALESVTLRRDVADKPLVEAKLKLTIYLGRSAP